MIEINVPERNKRVKKLLEETYLRRQDGAAAPQCHGVKISVTAGKGTAYRWIEIRFSAHVDVTDAEIEALIVGAGIYVSYFNRSDDDQDFGKLPCISIHNPRVQ